jgi:hypothetical protein
LAPKDGSTKILLGQTKPDERKSAAAVKLHQPDGPSQGDKKGKSAALAPQIFPFLPKF